MKIKYIVLILFCMNVFSVYADSGVDMGKETRVDSVLASVNGESITLLDVMLESGREEMRLTSLYSGARLYTEVAKLRKTVVDEIIVRKLVYKKYLEKPFPIEDQYIEEMLDNLAMSIVGGTRGSLAKKAEAMGTSIVELREKAKEKIAVDILLREYCIRPVSVTPKEVFEYYDKNKKDWMKQALYELELLQIAKNGGRSGSDPRKVCEKLKIQMQQADQNKFYQLTRVNSDAPNADSGGKIGWIEADKLRPEFSPVVLKMKKGEIQGPIETPEGFYFIRLSGFQPAEQIPFEKAAAAITAKLENQRRGELRKKYCDEIKKQALIRYYF